MEPAVNSPYNYVAVILLIYFNITRPYVMVAASTIIALVRQINFDHKNKPGACTTYSKRNITHLPPTSPHAIVFENTEINSRNLTMPVSLILPDVIFL